MKNNTFLIAILLVFGLAVLTVIYSQNKKTSQVLPVNETIPQNKEQISGSTENVPSEKQANIKYIYPMDKYDERVKIRWYGKYVDSSDRQNIPCGETFIGYHTGDDLEVFPEEIEKDVPVKAIAAGKVRMVSTVNGYGGLMVIEYDLEGQVATVYYGHIGIGTAKFAVNDEVNTGDEIALLGKTCSTQTDGERKHLHFSIHKGSELNVRGYVSSQNQLAGWLNPKETLSELVNKNP